MRLTTPVRECEYAEVEIKVGPVLPQPRISKDDGTAAQLSNKKPKLPLRVRSYGEAKLNIVRDVP